MLHWAELVAVLEIASCNGNANGDDCSTPGFSSYEEVHQKCAFSCWPKPAGGEHKVKGRDLLLFPTVRSRATREVENTFGAFEGL